MQQPGQIFSTLRKLIFKKNQSSESARAGVEKIFPGVSFGRPSGERPGKKIYRGGEKNFPPGGKKFYRGKKFSPVRSLILSEVRQD